MSSVIKKLAKHKLITHKYDFVTDTVYEVMTGSIAYGVSSDTSDMDIYAVCVPDKTMVFPHLTGHIYGFGPTPETFTVYQKHHMQLEEKEYDVAIYSLVNYFNLCADNNPNMVDSLFVPSRCILNINEVGKHMRFHKKMFLSKRIHEKLCGYAFKELKSLERYNPETSQKRKELVEKFGYDVKSAYHVVRLMLEAEQILMEYDLDLERNREHLKHVRSGEYTLEGLKQWFYTKEMELMKVYAESKIPLQPDFKALSRVLYECLEIHFGKLDTFVEADPKMAEKLEKIRRIVNE